MLRNPLAVLVLSLAASSASHGQERPWLEAEAACLRGYELAEQGKPSAAIEAYSEAIRLCPGYVVAYQNRSLARQMIGDLDGALEDADQAILLEPGNAALHSNRASFLVEKRNFDAALASCEEAIRLDPALAHPYFHRGFVQMEKGEFERARADFDHSVALAPFLAEPRIGRSEFFLCVGQPQLALADAETAIQLAPSPRAIVQRGAALAALGRPEEALEEYERALAVAPDTWNKTARTLSEIHLARGSLACDRNDTRTARTEYDAAVRVDPAYFRPWAVRGWFLLDLGDPEGACRHFEKALELAPGAGYGRENIEYGLELARARSAARPVDRPVLQTLFQGFPENAAIVAATALIGLGGALAFFGYRRLRGGGRAPDGAS